jgi:hypothetical protein
MELTEAVKDLLVQDGQGAQRECPPFVYGPSGKPARAIATPGQVVCGHRVSLTR